MSRPPSITIQHRHLSFNISFEVNFVQRTIAINLTFHISRAMATVPQVINQIWTFTSSLINNGTASEIVIPVNFRNIIGQQGIDDLAKRFRYVLELSPILGAKLTTA